MTLLLETVEYVAPTDVENHPENYRRHDLDGLKASLEAHGQYRPLVVQKSTGYVLAGNGTLRAALALDLDQVAIVRVDVDDDAAKKILAVDNRSQERGENDQQALAQLLAGLDDLAGTGYDVNDLTELQQLTGQLGHDQAGFLDELRAPGAGDPDAPDPEPVHDTGLVNLNFPVTVAQRNRIVTRLSEIRDEAGLSTTAAALDRLCGYEPDDDGET